MKAIRRLYIYLVSFISLEVVLWGLIGLARSAFAGDQIGSGVSQLASALSLIFVGVPVFLLHWWLAQRHIHEDAEERFARLRTVFLYASLLALLIPITQNFLAITNRIWLKIFRVPTSWAFIGIEQSWTDNIIAIIMNALLAGYIYSVLRKDWSANPQGSSFSETRRLYRYIWMLYSLTMVVIGAQQVLQFIFNLTETLGNSTQASLANGLSLIIIGTPVWVYIWQIIQKSTDHHEEKFSTLRLVIFYGLSLIGIGGVLIPAGIICDAVLRAILGEAMSLGGFFTEIGGPLSAAIPLGSVWTYFGGLLRTEVDALPDTPRRSGLRRLYFYILSFIGLIATFSGVHALLTFLLDLIVHNIEWGFTLRERLTGALATLIVGLPLWLSGWRPMIAEATQAGESGDHSRRSLVRKIYLYLVLFLGVIGVMLSAGSFIFQVLSKLLGDPADNFARTAWMLFEILILFGILLVYHWSILRDDGQKAEQSLAARHASFPILILAPEIGEFSEALVNALNREAPSLPVSIHTLDDGTPEKADYGLVILPGKLAVNPPDSIQDWLREFDGNKIVIPTPSEDWLWTFGSGRSLSSLVQQSAIMARNLAEGENPTGGRETSGWMIFLYVLAGLVGLPIIFSIIGLVAELFFRM